MDEFWFVLERGRLQWHRHYSRQSEEGLGSRYHFVQQVRIDVIMRRMLSFSFIKNETPALCVLLDIAMPTCYDFVQNQSSFEGEFNNNNFFSHLNFSEIILMEQRHLTVITFAVKPAVIQQL